MSVMKTKRAMAKRVKLTGRGKVMMKRKNRSHLLAKKSRGRKRRLRMAGQLEGKQARNVKRMVGC